MTSQNSSLSREMKTPSSSGEIVIRQFKPSDAPQVHALLSEGFVDGSGSPQKGAQRRNITSPISFLTYAGFLAGLGFMSTTSHIHHLTGAALSLGSAALFFYVRWRIKRWFMNFCATARETDMKNIVESYGISFTTDGVYLPEKQGAGGFWVAVLEVPECQALEVVGYVGLDYRSNTDPTSAELRRMIVSPRHRRRRIGSLLMTALMDHARSHAPPLKMLELETIQNGFQPGPLRLYESYGFRVIGQRAVRAGPFFDMTMVHLTMKLDADA